MGVTVRHIYRHPVKSLGEESLEAVTLETDRHMPWDRAWAILCGGADWDPERPAWREPDDFVTQRHAPRLAQIRCTFDEAAGRLTLSHADAPGLTIRPDTDAGAAALTEWIAPLAHDTNAGPYRLVRLPQAAFTDDPDAHLLICSTATLAALEEMAGRPLEHIRFRANLWLDGLDPWQELDLGGAELRIGEARLRLTDRCERCNATNASPKTGRRDTQLPALMRRRFGHYDFGIYARVDRGGRLARGDRAVLA